jgi:hypothetical protein
MKLSVKVGIVIGGILLLFIFLNPSLDKFKEHLGYVSHYGLRRTSEFLVCTVYEDGTQDQPVKYLGILSNFIKLYANNPTTEIYTDTTRTVDLNDKDIVDTTMNPDGTHNKPTVIDSATQKAINSYNRKHKNLSFNEAFDEANGEVPMSKKEKRIADKKNKDDLDELFIESSKN